MYLGGNQHNEDGYLFCCFALFSSKIANVSSSPPPWKQFHNRKGTTEEHYLIVCKKNWNNFTISWSVQRKRLFFYFPCFSVLCNFEEVSQITKYYLFISRFFLLLLRFRGSQNGVRGTGWWLIDLGCRWN